MAIAPPLCTSQSDDATDSHLSGVNNIETQWHSGEVCQKKFKQKSISKKHLAEIHDINVQNVETPKKTYAQQKAQQERWRAQQQRWRARKKLFSGESLIGKKLNNKR